MANTDVLHKTTKWSNMCLGNVFEDRLVGRVILSTQMWLFHKKKTQIALLKSVQTSTLKLFNKLLYFQHETSALCSHMHWQKKKEKIYGDELALN